MDTPKLTPIDFFLWVSSMVTLYASIFAFISLLFAYIDYTFPDPLRYYGDPYSSGISYYMASLIVLTPVFIILMRIIHQSIERDPSRGHIWIRRWALYLTLFIAAATIVGDLITLVMYFFNGDITTRFLLKVAVILLVGGGGFLHFLADLRGYWERSPGQARTMGYALGILVIVSIIAGFFIIGTPWQARLYRYDEQKVSDLQGLQSQIVNYWQTKQSLPAQLSDLRDPISYYTVPYDPQSGAAYEYRSVGATTFELCATFNAPTQSGASAIRMAPVETYPMKGTEDDNWHHEAGRTCFERTIDPERYPPFTKPVLK